MTKFLDKDDSRSTTAKQLLQTLRQKNAKASCYSRSSQNKQSMTMVTADLQLRNERN